MTCNSNVNLILALKKEYIKKNKEQVTECAKPLSKRMKEAKEKNAKNRLQEMQAVLTESFHFFFCFVLFCFVVCLFVCLS